LLENFLETIKRSFPEKASSLKISPGQAFPRKAGPAWSKDRNAPALEQGQECPGLEQKQAAPGNVLC
jgi:hypothetical protein